MDRFERGNLVRIIKGHSMTTIENGVISEIERPYGSKRTAVVEYSYNQRYGDGSNTGDYSIIWMDNGSSEAWFQPRQLELIDVGGEYLIEEAQKRRKEIKQKNTDIRYIKQNWNKLSEEGFSSDTMLFLLRKIGFKSSFERNGEYFILFHDWNMSFPLYNFLFMQTDRSKLLNMQSEFQYNIIDLFDEIQSL